MLSSDRCTDASGYMTFIIVRTSADRASTVLAQKPYAIKSSTLPTLQCRGVLSQHCTPKQAVDQILQLLKLLVPLDEKLAQDALQLAQCQALVAFTKSNDGDSMSSRCRAQQSKLFSQMKRHLALQRHHGDQ